MEPGIDITSQCFVQAACTIQPWQCSLLDRYVDRLVDDLKRLTSESEKMGSMSRLMVLKRDEVLSEQHDLEPKLEVMRQKMKELQRQVWHLVLFYMFGIGDGFSKMAPLSIFIGKK